MTAFEKIEKTVMIVAGLLAIFPLLQYWNEADDRRLNREATLMVAYMSCLGSGGFGVVSSGVSSGEMHRICSEIARNLEP